MVCINSYPQICSYDDTVKFCSSISTQIKDLTELQKEVINDKHFWDVNNNLMIKGSAGSGKTLLSLIALMSHSCQKRKMLYLVPFKSLLNEKFLQFKQYFNNKIYRSSSDYFEKDNEIFEGNCDIAIVIYEKLENYLRFNENSSQIFSKYDLIVFDELSVLTTINRGLRVHYILNQYIKYSKQFYGVKLARILGLTVPECIVPSYDDLNFYIFTKYNKAIKLNETIYQLDEQKFYPKDDIDKWIFEIKFSSNKTPESFSELDDEELDNYINNRLVLQQLVLQHRNLNHNIIVFCNSKRATKGIAKYLADTIRVNNIKHGDWSNELERIKKDLDDNSFACIDEKLIYCCKYGVMIHHAELPNDLRTKIEQEYSRKNGKSRINILVSTETVAYGINCSADVVVIYNRTKVTEDDDYPCMSSKHGDYCWRYINSVEYQNYIGRAGRLGFQGKNINGPEGYAYMLTQNDDSTKLVREMYFSNKLFTTYNFQQLFTKKIRNNTYSCIINILDSIETDETKLFSQKNVVDAISSLTGSKKSAQNACYANQILLHMKNTGLIEHEENEKYSFTSQGEALRGKHVPNEAINKFNNLRYQILYNSKDNFSKFLYVFELLEIIKSTDSNIISRNKNDLISFAQSCSLYITELLRLGQLNPHSFDYLNSQANTMNSIIEDLKTTNNEGFCYLSYELIQLVNKFANAIILNEWSKGILLSDIFKSYGIKVPLGYIQKIACDFVYLSGCFENYINSLGYAGEVIEIIKTVSHEIRYGYPYACITASDSRLNISCRSLIANSIKASGVDKTSKFLSEFVNTHKSSLEQSNYEIFQRLKLFLNKCRRNDNEQKK